MQPLSLLITGTMSYSVSAILDGHSNDVRCLTPFPGGSLVSGSRDKTVKLWASSDGQGWSTQVVYEGHTHYVSCVSVMPPNDEYKEGLIYTGSNDAKIRAYVPYSVQPDHTLEGHSATVASLFISKNQTLLSCSWDTTAKVWLNKRTVMTLQDHEVALWCGVILSEIGFMVTGAADGNLKVWKAGQCKATIKAHSQAVRDLAVISRDEVVSCSNDGRICYWRIDNANCNAVMSMSFEDVDFVYSIFAVDAGAMVVSSGENTGIKIFKEGKLSQTLGVPALSAWNVCILDSGDIAVGCSDNRIYIFTSDDNRKASPEIVALYEAEMNNVHQQESMDTQEELPEEVSF
jgi:phospholipase A-2-activating protein